jgi:hypothetical protein
MLAWKSPFRKLGLISMGFLIQFYVHGQAVPQVASAQPPNYLADLKGYLAQYHDAIAREIGSGDAAVYYATSYYLHGLAAGAEASGDLAVMDALVGFVQQMMAQARPLVRNGLTYQEWGPWDPNGNPQQLNTFQATGALARIAAIIKARPAFKARYGAAADQIVAFVDQSIFKYWFDKYTGVYSDPAGPRLGGQIPWLPVALGGWGEYPVWNDKCSHFGMMTAWMYQATGNPLYLEYASRVAMGFRAHVTVQNGNWIWDKGTVPIRPGDNRAGSPDTSHANREAMMVVAMYEAGIEFRLPDVKAVASTFTRLIWNQDEADPKFNNYIDGGNPAFATHLPWENGNIYLGWDMVGRYSAAAQRVLALSYQAMKAGGALNPSLANNATSYGRVMLSGTLARNMAP